MNPSIDRNEPQPALTKIATVALYGVFGPPILTAARSFRNAGIDVVVLNIGNHRPPVWSSAVSFADCMSLEDVGTPAGISVINGFIRKTNAQALLSDWDPQTAWLAANRDLLPPSCKLLASKQQALQAVQAKHDQLQVAQRCGFTVLPTWKLSRLGDVSLIDPSKYPVCLRPSSPLGVNPRFKAEVLRSPSELKAFLHGIKWGPEPLLVQPFLPLPSVVIHGVRSESGEILALEAFIAPMKFQTLSLELRPLPLDENIAQCCRRFVADAGITGPFHFDLLYSPQTGNFYYLEINVRLGGTTDKIFRLGFDEPLLTLSAFGFDVPVRPYRAPAGRSASNRRTVLKHMFWILRGRVSQLDYPVVSPLRRLLLSLRSFVWARESIASVRDLRGTWYFYTGGLRPVRVSRRSAPAWMTRILRPQQLQREPPNPARQAAE